MTRLVARLLKGGNRHEKETCTKTKGRTEDPQNPKGPEKVFLRLPAYPLVAKVKKATLL